MSTVNEPALKHLLRRGLDGDAGAYREFLSAASRILRQFVLRRLPPEARGEAEDVVQEALLAIHSRIYTYDPEVPVTAWMRAIARYKMIDMLRARGRNQTLSLEDVGDLPEPTGANLDASITLRKLMSALPVRWRVPLELTKLQGHSIADSAARIGSSKAAVKSNVRRGLQALRGLLRP